MYKKGRTASNPSPLMVSGKSSFTKINPSEGASSESPAHTSGKTRVTPNPAPPEKKPTVTESAHPVPHPLKNRDSCMPKDLMISYSHADNEMMLKVREALEDNGISVWVDVSGLQAGVDFLSKIGEAIIDSKLFLSLLSTTSVKSKYCQDELALAYVSNRSIFPITLDEVSDLKPQMDTGMKLQLARYEWTTLGRDPSTFKENFNELLKKLKDELINQQKDKQAKEAKSEPPKDTKERPPLIRQDTHHNLNKKNRRQTSPNSLGIEVLEADQFWKDNFGSKEEVGWDRFVESFKEVFKAQLDQVMNTEEQDWLLDVLMRELEVEEQILYKFNLMAFCSLDGQYQPLWERVNDQASESLAMVQVFDMDSTVRVEAIENLGKFRSAAVIDALRDLLSDHDANVRAVATISLARTDAKDPVTIKFLMKMLNDKDRLVREAGCLALGHLQAKQAVNKLLHMWRNDVISHVREAANVALGQIGGDEVEKAMRVTKILADEIRQLTTS